MYYVPHTMEKHRIANMIFGKIYPLYVNKVTSKGRTTDELNEVLRWLTGYSQPQLESQMANAVTLETFFAEAPNLNPNRELIKGVICGVRIEEIEDPLMREVRYMDKLIDELAKGRPMEKILRQA